MPKFGVKGPFIDFSIPSAAREGSIVFFNGNGRMTATIPLKAIASGKHQVTLPPLSSGLYLMNITIDKFTTTMKLINTGIEMHLSSMERKCSADGNSRLAKAVAETLDSIRVTKSGYKTKEVAIDSYIKEDMVIVLEKDSVIECPEFSVPSFYDLQNMTELPDPFLFQNGTRMTKKSEWECRKKEIAALAQAFIYGEKPGKPDVVEATYNSGSLNITCTEGGNTGSFIVKISGNNGTGQMPAIIKIDGGSGGYNIPSGVASISYSVSDVADGNRGNFSGVFGKLYPNNKTAGSLIAWAWGASRIIDALEIPEIKEQTKIDPTRLGVIGCSYAGKAAMSCGVWDDRMALTLTVEGGAGGIMSWRIGEDYRDPSGGYDGCQYASEAYDEAAWMGTPFEQFGDENVDKLPVDMHEVAALCAPDRGFLAFSSNILLWTCPQGTWQAGVACHIVYEALGAPDNMGILMSSYDHCQGGNGVNEPEVFNNFVQKFLFGDENANTSPDIGVKNNGGFTVEDKYIPWDIPILE